MRRVGRVGSYPAARRDDVVCAGHHAADGTARCGGAGVRPFGAGRRGVRRAVAAGAVDGVVGGGVGARVDAVSFLAGAWEKASARDRQKVGVRHHPADSSVAAATLARNNRRNRVVVGSGVCGASVQVARAVTNRAARVFAQDAPKKATACDRAGVCSVARVG